MSVSDGNMKCPIGKLIFAVNLQLELFRATVANADTGRLKSLHTLFDTYFDHIMAKIGPNHMVQHVQNYDVFDKKSSFLKPFLTKL